MYTKINKVVGYFNTGSDDIELMIVMKSILLQYSIFPRDWDTILFMDELRKIKRVCSKILCNPSNIKYSISNGISLYKFSTSTQLPVPVSTTIKGEKETRSTMDVLKW